jgi:hypothetical protein
MAWSDQARAAAIEARRRRRRSLKKNDLSSLKPETREILKVARVRQNKYWAGPNAKNSRKGMAEHLRKYRNRGSRTRRSNFDRDWEKHQQRTRGFD